MNRYVNRFDRMVKIAAKQRLNTIYGITIQSRGYSKTMSRRALYRTIMNEFAPYFKVISVRWCESFEILDNRKRRLCYVHLAEI